MVPLTIVVAQRRCHLDLRPGVDPEGHSPIVLHDDVAVITATRAARTAAEPDDLPALVRRGPKPRFGGIRARADDRVDCSGVAIRTVERDGSVRRTSDRTRNVLGHSACVRRIRSETAEIVRRASRGLTKSPVVVGAIPANSGPVRVTRHGLDRAHAPAVCVVGVDSGAGDGGGINRYIID